MTTGETPSGLVVAVCMSGVHGFPTYPQDSVPIGPEGIHGDAHSGPTRESFRKPGTFKPNDRPISIVANEVRLEMNDRFGIAMQPGDFNEQVLVEGLGDLGDVPIGAHVLFGSGVRLEVVDKAWPCQRLDEYNQAPGLMEALRTRDAAGKVYNRRGILAKVLDVGTLAPGVSAHIVPATT
jgi:hypothetical protein